MTEILKDLVGNLDEQTIEAMIENQPFLIFNLENPSDKLKNIFLLKAINIALKDPDMFFVIDVILKKHNLTEKFKKALVLS
jgi:hypothetical protein